MKRFSIFCAALFAAATSFAAVTYELNGGVTNDEGWMSKNDMFQACMADCGVTGLASLDELKATGNDAALTTICTKLTDVTGMLTGEKWAWLEAYIMQVQNADAAATALTEDVSSAGWRYAVAAFFIEGKRGTWPVSTDFSGAGKDEAYIPAWKHAYANPTEPTGEWVLNAPYLEGETFAGWYWNADFSGEKVTTINAESEGTLYAKFGSYVPTIAEVRALADDTETLVAGVVNHVDGKNIYIQDATGGILVYTSETPSCTVGQKIVAKGVKVIYAGAPEVKSAVIESAEAAQVFDAVPFETLAALVADSLEHKYFATNVRIPGVIIKSYDSKGNPVVTDNTFDVTCYKMVLDQTAFPVGTNVDVEAVAGWYNGFQFVGDVKGITVSPVAKKDTYAYPTRGKYSLANNWIISNVEDNYAANKPGPTQMVRGMAAKDGIMYFINRDSKSIVRVDAKTGEKMEPVVIQGADTLFKVQGEDGVWSDGATYGYNDLKFDSEGHCLIGACLTGANKCQTFFIYMVDLETGACTKIIEDVLWENPGLDGVRFRFDAFGVNGDVTKNAAIMAVDSYGTFNAYRWLITDGVAGEGEQIANLSTEVAGGDSEATQVFPQDEKGELFYVDGFSIYPTLFYGTPAEGASAIDSFDNVPTGVKVPGAGTDSISMQTGHNGVLEFQVGEEYFLLMAATGTAGTPPSCFALYKFADEDRAFEGLEPLWYFPAKGMGTATNGCRTAVPYADVIDDKTAVLYVYTTDNGYGSYTFTIGDEETAVENVGATKAEVKKVVENGQIFIMKNDVKYNALGAEVK